MTGPVQAQTTFQEQARRLQNINAYLLDFRAATPPAEADHRHWEAVFDVYPQPNVDAQVGRKNEPLDPPSWVPKLRMRYVFSSGFHLGAAYAPGIAFEGYEADYWSVELGQRFAWRAWRFGVRASYSDGDVTGPITEVDAADFFRFENRGIDLSIARVIGAFHVYALAGANEIDTSVRVEADGARITNDDEAPYAGIGIAWDRGPWRLVLEQHATDDYLQHLILSAAYRF